MNQSRIVISRNRCDFCGTCVAVCTADAITLEESAISVNQATCTVCLNCVHICPLGVPEVIA